VTSHDAGVQLVHGLREDGTPELAVGISVVDADRLVEALHSARPGIAASFDRKAFVRAQEDDVIAWLATLDPRWTRPPGSVDHLLETLAASRMSHLVPIARRLLVQSGQHHSPHARNAHAQAPAAV
jgi:hypothetical protein